MQSISKNCAELRRVGYQIAGVVVCGGTDKSAMLKLCNEKIKTLTETIIQDARRMEGDLKYAISEMKDNKRKLDQVDKTNKKLKTELKDSDKLFAEMRKDITSLSSSQSVNASTSSQIEGSSELHDLSASEISLLLDDSLDQTLEDDNSQQDDKAQEKDKPNEDNNAEQSDDHLNI